MLERQRLVGGLLPDAFRLATGHESTLTDRAGDTCRQRGAAAHQCSDLRECSQDFLTDLAASQHRSQRLHDPGGDRARVVEHGFERAQEALGLLDVLVGQLLLGAVEVIQRLLGRLRVSAQGIPSLAGQTKSGDVTDTDDRIPQAHDALGSSDTQVSRLAQQAGLFLPGVTTGSHGTVVVQEATNTVGRTLLAGDFEGSGDPCSQRVADVCDRGHTGVDCRTDQATRVQADLADQRTFLQLANLDGSLLECFELLDLQARSVLDLVILVRDTLLSLLFDFLVESTIEVIAEIVGHIEYLGNEEGEQVSLLPFIMS